MDRPKSSPEIQEQRRQRKLATDKARRAELRKIHGPGFRGHGNEPKRQARIRARLDWLASDPKCGFCETPLSTIARAGILPTYCSPKCQRSARTARTLRAAAAGKCQTDRCDAPREEGFSRCAECREKQRTIAAKARRIEAAEREVSLASEALNQGMAVEADVQKSIASLRRAQSGAPKPPPRPEPNASPFRVSLRQQARDALQARILPMLLGEGDKRDECLRYSECIGRVGKASAYAEGHCPVSCAQYTTISRYDLVSFEGSRRPHSIDA